MQDTYNKSIGDLARAINGLEEMIKQQGRDVQYMKNNLRGQRSMERPPPSTLPPVRGNFQPFCQHCNKVGHRTEICRRRPVSSEVVCYRCNRPGHIKRDCRQGKKLGRGRENVPSRPNYRNASQIGAGTHYGQM